MNKKERIKAQVLIGILCCVLSFAVVVQTRSVRKNEKNISLALSEANSLLKEENANLKQENANLKMNLSAAQNDIEEYRRIAEEEGDYEEILTAQLRRAEVLAGLCEVSGEGIKLTLTEGEGALEGAGFVEDFIIHDSDLRLLVTELSAAGAEAFSINGERIVSTSSIRCVGPAIQINGKPTAPPFEIYAIGNAKTLKSALSTPGGIVDMFSSYRIGVKIEIKSKVVLPAYSGLFEAEYASPTDNGEVAR